MASTCMEWSQGQASSPTPAGNNPSDNPVTTLDDLYNPRDNPRDNPSRRVSFMVAFWKTLRTHDSTLVGPGSSRTFPPSLSTYTWPRLLLKPAGEEWREALRRAGSAPGEGGVGERERVRAGEVRVVWEDLNEQQNQRYIYIYIYDMYETERER